MSTNESFSISNVNKTKAIVFGGITDGDVTNNLYVIDIYIDVTESTVVSHIIFSGKVY